ncbi:phage antirepressor KilAC domain-containing protein [Paraburkholderia oxyphila]|uniref:phage antirepressor KilAC domain-containing protein n=1 Tax=Paraburkholderia oxyphila TaxID=614212 RepID=UPI0006943A32|nr:phage antirepressor KilAC domain-containing protein [Paraburkholderia oxyphila]
MSNLMNFDPLATVTMNSREIADILKVRHDSVKRAIERLAERGAIVQPPMVDEAGTDAMGRPRDTQVYVFSGKKGRNDTYTVVAQLCPEFTAAIVERWLELEEGLKTKSPPLPNFEDPAEAAMAWAEQYRAKTLAIAQADEAQALADRRRGYIQQYKAQAVEYEKELTQQDRTIKALEPAKQFTQTFVERDEDMGFREVVKMLKGKFSTITETSFREFLVKSGFQYKLAGKYVPKEPYDSNARGLFRPTVNSFGDKEWKFTRKGFLWISELWEGEEKQRVATQRARAMIRSHGLFNKVGA